MSGVMVGTLGPPRASRRVKVDTSREAELDRPPPRGTEDTMMASNDSVAAENKFTKKI